MFHGAVIPIHTGVHWNDAVTNGDNRFASAPSQPQAQALVPQVVRQRITIMRIHLSSITNDVLWLIADADAAAEQLPTLLVTDDNAVKSMCIAAGASCSPYSSSDASHHCNSALSRCRHPSCPR